MKKAFVVLACLLSIVITLDHKKSALGATTTDNQAGPSGGTGGEYFNTGSLFPFRIAELRISSGKYIDSIQIIYVREEGDRCTDSYLEGNRYGGTGGTMKTFRLACDEFIVKLGGKYGRYVDSLYVMTNKGRQMEWGGTGGSAMFFYTLPDRNRLHGFWGRAGRYIDAVGVTMRTY